MDDSSFSSLRVPSQHYGEVEALRLDGNGLETLPEKLLEMRLNRAFSARDNRLKTVRVFQNAIFGFFLWHAILL